MSRLRFAAPDAGFLPLRAWDTREYCVSFSLSKRWTVRASYIRYVTAEAHRTVRFFIMWMSVDKWIRCGLPTGLELSNVGLWANCLPHGLPGPDHHRPGGSGIRRASIGRNSLLELHAAAFHHG